MAAGANQKLKLLILAEIFSRETDDAHRLTLPEITEKLNARDVTADRKTLYRDIEELRRFGYDIIAQQEGRQVTYHLGSREFELPELKLLVDAVQSSKFITEKKSRELIEKLEGLVSRHDARHLHRQVLIHGRVKTMNESIYYNVDMIHEAMGVGVQIRFHYFQWTVEKQMSLRHGGKWYQVSPWSLLWDDENYYMAAYDAESGTLKHYRVDKMLDLALTEETRLGGETFAVRSAPGHSGGIFGMHGGAETRVTLEGENTMAGVLIDRFGRDIIMAPKDAAHFTAQVDVVPSPHFLGWIIALEGVRITAPTAVVEQMQALTERLRQQYLEET